jgi:CheY-like chemotaxis protein
MNTLPDSAIICLDDDEVVLNALSIQMQQIVNTEKVVLEFFLDPQEALTAIPGIIELKIKVIFVLTDYHMPGMTGIQFIKKLKADYPEIRFIMLSGQANENLVEDLIRDNFLDYFVSKPWTMNDLLEKIKLLVPEDTLKQKS